HSGSITSASLSSDGKYLVSGGFDGTVRLWDVTTGRSIRATKGHQVVSAVAFSASGKLVVSGGHDGVVKMWDAKTGTEIAAMYALPDDQWLTMTSVGFFAASTYLEPDAINVVRGNEVTAITQVHQSLYNPDLVRAAIAGDPDGEVKRAAAVISLERVL